jgi:hypothetical protein
MDARRDSMPSGIYWQKGDTNISRFCLLCGSSQQPDPYTRCNRLFRGTRMSLHGDAALLAIDLDTCHTRPALMTGSQSSAGVGYVVRNNVLQGHHPSTAGRCSCQAD